MSIHAIRTVIVGTLALLPLGALPVSAQTSADQAIFREQYKLQRNSRDVRTYHRLGDAYIQKARETGDLSYLGLAEKALRRAIELAPGDGDAWGVLGDAWLELGRYDRAADAYDAMMRRKSDLSSLAPGPSRAARPRHRGLAA